MEQTKYRIGDVANMIGMSRDTLRHYEKLGILSSRREESGYRYYTDQDIARLVTILYQRKMDIGLDDIASLSRMHHDESQRIRIMDEQLRREEAQIRRHQRNIARIRMTRDDFTCLHSHVGQVFIKELPQAYVIVPHTGLSESIPLWFRYSSDYEGMDMMYILDEFSWKEQNSTMEIAWRNTELILKTEVRDLVDYPIEEHTQMPEKPTLCLSVFVTSPERIPRQEHIRPLVEAARAQGLLTSQLIYSTFTSQDLSSEQPTYYLQIYLPVF